MKSVCIVVQSVYEFDPRVQAEGRGAGRGRVLRRRAGAAPPGRDRRRYTLNGVNVYTLPLGKKRGSLARYLFEYAAFFLWAFVRSRS